MHSLLLTTYISTFISTLIGCTNSNSVDESTTNNQNNSDTIDGIEDTDTVTDKISDSEMQVYTQTDNGTVSKLNFMWFGEDIIASQNQYSFPYALTDEQIDYEITPKIAGKFQVEANHRLSFVPTEALPPNQSFTIKINKIQRNSTTNQFILPKEISKWTKSVETPAFKIAYVALKKADFSKNTADFTIRLSHDIPLEFISNNIKVSIDGTTVRNPKIQKMGPAEFLLNLKNQGSLFQTNIAIDVKPISFPNSSIKSASFSWNTQLSSQQNIALYGPYFKETAGGFMVEYICDDSAVERRTWHWNSSFDFDEKISQRCTVDTNQLLDQIQIDPPVSNISIYPRERGFAILGNFQKGKYDITIPANISSQDGGTILEPNINSIEIPLRKPTLRFFSQGRYLPTSSWSNLHFQYRNMNELQLVVREVQKQNLHNWLGNQYEKVETSEGDIIINETISLTSQLDRTHHGTLNLRDRIPNRKPGIYEVMIQDPKSGAKTYTHVNVTDMNILAKKHVSENGETHIWAWVLDVHSNASQSNVNLSLMTPAGNTTATCVSDAEGFCEFRIPKDENNNPAFAIYAEKQSSTGMMELAYLTFSDLQIDLGLYDTGGAVGANNIYRIASHTDRGAYRPGDSVQLTGIVRNKSNTAPKGGLPVQLQIVDGRGVVVQEYTLNTTKGGVVSKKIDIPTQGNTGTWKALFSIKGGKKHEVIGSQTTSFKVENLMPERMNIQAEFKNKDAMGGTPLSGAIDARYLFGSPASEAKFTVRCDVESTPFQPASNANYIFGSETAFENFYLGTVEGTLNKNGEGEFACPTPERLKDLPGMATVIASIDVLEGGSGRSTKKTIKTRIHPTDTYIGLQIGTDQIKKDTNYPIAGIIVDWNGKKQSSVQSIDLQFSQIDYSYNWYYNEESGYYEREHARFELPITQNNIKVENGLFRTNITGDQNVAEYRIRASYNSTVTLLDVEGEDYYWYYESDRIQTPDPFRPDALDINTPKMIFLKDEATVSTTVSYPGRLLWTLENDGIIKQEWMDVQPGEVSWKFSMADQPYQNNVYVSALLVKDAHADNAQAYMPSRAFGTKSIPLRSLEFAHNIKVSVPKEVQANKVMNVDLDLGRNLEANTVAMVSVVDEGLLSLTNFATPDPATQLFPKMPLNINTYETVGWGISAPNLDGSAKAGGGDDGAQRRKAQIVKPVALWSGLVDVPSSGKVSIPFTMPQYSGEVRVMVVTASDTRFAATDANVFVRDPLTMQSTLPRFLTEGDQFDIPVFLTNLSGKAQDVKISLKVSDGEGQRSSIVQFLGKDSAIKTIQPDEQIVAVFQAKALVETGFAKFEIIAEAGDLKSTETLEVPFSSRKPTERTFQKIQLSDLVSGFNQEVNLTPFMQGWTSEDTSIWATNNPYSASLVKIRDLLHYPYGCVEQTSSSLRPLITAADMLKNIDPQTIADKPINDMVQAGIDRLASMQTPDGGIGYWPGNSSSHPWGTAYATHVLLDAQEAGYSIMPSLLDNSIAYLEKMVEGNYDYGYYQYAMPTAKPYAHYVLARVGKGKPENIRQLLTQYPQQNYESEYMLKTALYLSGDRSYTSELQNLNNLDKLDAYYDYWSFRTRTRSKALILSLHQELFGSNDPKGEALANEIHNTLLEAKNRYLSTQVLGWSTYALSKRVLSDTEWKTPTMSINGKNVTPANQNNTGSTWQTWDTYRKQDQIKIQGQGSDAYIMLSTVGIRLDGTHQFGDETVQVQRDYYTPNAQPLDFANHRFGDEVIVVVTLSNLSNRPVHELALVDRIPAGWEINNPTLDYNNDLDMYYELEAWSRDYVSIKDNQIEVFGDLQANSTVQFVYSTRATVSGSFYIPPISLEAMYDDSIWSKHAGQSIQISADWGGSLL